MSLDEVLMNQVPGLVGFWCNCGDTAEYVFTARK
jgi:hypothetical protein